MWIAFLSEQYDAEGGACDMLGTVETLEYDSLMPLIMNFIVNEMLDSWRGKYHEDDKRAAGFSLRGSRLSFLNLVEKKRHMTCLWVDRSGQEISIIGSDAVLYPISGSEDYPITPLPIKFTYCNEKEKRG